MAIKLSGPLSLSSDISPEFIDDAPHALSEFYRGGDRVPDIPINANVPASGEIGFGDLYGAVKSTDPVIPAGVVVFYDGQEAQTLPLRWAEYVDAQGYFVKGTTTQSDVGVKIEEALNIGPVVSLETDFSGEHDSTGLSAFTGGPVTTTGLGLSPPNAYARSDTSGSHKHFINLNLANPPRPPYKALRAAISTGPVQNLPANSISFGATQLSSSHQRFIDSGNRAVMISTGADSLGVSTTYQGFTTENGAHTHITETLQGQKNLSGASVVYPTAENDGMSSGNHLHDYTAILSVPSIKTKVLSAWKIVQQSRVNVGAIYMYTGDIDNLLEDWYLCDGNNDTLDMSDYFIGINDGEINHGAAHGSETNRTVLTTNVAGGDLDDWTHAHNTQTTSGFGRLDSVLHSSANIQHRHTVDVRNYDDSYVPPHIKLAFIQYKPPLEFIEIAVSAQQVDEGQQMTFTVRATGIPYVSPSFYWELVSVAGQLTSEDVVGGELSGTIQFENDQATVTITLNEDMSLFEGIEIIKLQVRSESNLGPIEIESPEITITDTSRDVPIITNSISFSKFFGNPSQRIYFFSEQKESLPRVFLRFDPSSKHNGRTIYWKIVPGTTDSDWWTYNADLFALVRPLDVSTGLISDRGTITIINNYTYVIIPFAEDIDGSEYLENFRIQFYADPEMVQNFEETEELLVWTGSADIPVFSGLFAVPTPSTVQEGSVYFTDFFSGGRINFRMSVINPPDGNVFSWRIINISGYPSMRAEYLEENSLTGVFSKNDLTNFNGEGNEIFSTGDSIPYIKIKNNLDFGGQYPVFGIEVTMTPPSGSPTIRTIGTGVASKPYYRLKPNGIYPSSQPDENVLVQTRFTKDTDPGLIYGPNSTYVVNEAIVSGAPKLRVFSPSTNPDDHLATGGPLDSGTVFSHVENNDFSLQGNKNNQMYYENPNDIAPGGSLSVYSRAAWSANFQNTAWSVEAFIKFPSKADIDAILDRGQHNSVRTVAHLLGNNLGTGAVYMQQNVIDQTRIMSYSLVSSSSGLDWPTSSYRVINQSTIGNNKIKDGDWNHFVFSWLPTSTTLATKPGIVKIFLNGQLIAFNTTSLDPAETGVLDWFFEPTSFFKFDNSSPPLYGTCEIDNFRIFTSDPWNITGYNVPGIPFKGYTGDPQYIGPDIIEPVVIASSQETAVVYEGQTVAWEFGHYNEEGMIYIATLTYYNSSGFSNADFAFVDSNGNFIGNGPELPYVDSEGRYVFYLDRSGVNIDTAEKHIIRAVMLVDNQIESVEGFQLLIRNYAGGAVVASPKNDGILLNHNTTITTSTPSYNVYKGDTISFTLTTTNLLDTTFSWSVRRKDDNGYYGTDGSFGNVTTVNNSVSFNVTIPPFANEYVLEINAAGGKVHVSQTITAYDSATYSVSPASNSVNEGNSLIFNVTTTNVFDGTVLYWTVTNSGDLSPASGTVVINNNIGSFSITAISDLTTEGSETFTASLKTGSASGTVVATSSSTTINDTSTTPAPTYSATAATSQNEDQTITVVVDTTQVANGTTLYYTVASVSGTVNSSDFVSSNTGSFTITNNRGSFNLQARNDELTEGTETYRVSIRTGSTSGTVVANTANITLNDTSKAISVSIAASTSLVNEGSTVTFSIATTNAPNGKSFTWEMTSSQYFTASDFTDNAGSGTIFISNNAASLSRTLKNDAAWDGVESFSINIKDGSTIKATSPVVKVNDTSNPGNHPTTFIHPDFTSRSLTAGVFDSIPVSTEWNENICKIIYTRDEMQRGGWYGPRVINGLYVGVAQTPPQHNFNNYRVYVGNVTASPGQDFTLNATNDIRCYGHDRYFTFGFTSSGFKFDRSFTWDGESNIGIIFAWNVEHRTIFQSYVLGQTMVTDTGQYNGSARNSPSYTSTDSAGLVNNYRPLILFVTSTLTSHRPIPYLYSPDWVDEYASTYGYTTTTQRNNFLTRGRDLGNNIYRSNSFLGNINGVDRYGLYRRPDGGGLAFWTDWCLDRGLTSTSTTFLQNFFGGLSGNEDSRSRTAGKQFDAGPDGIGDFYDKS